VLSKTHKFKLLFCSNSFFSCFEEYHATNLNGKLIYQIIVRIYKMKKIIASAVVAAATLSASQAAVFNGYSAGLSGGSFTSNNRAKLSILNNTAAKGKLNKTFATYGIHFDYDRSSANSFYWGLGLDAMFFAGKKTHTFTNGKMSLKYSWTSELDARFGYNICNNAAVYALVGLRAYHKKINYSGSVRVAGRTTTTADKMDKTRFAPVIGGGVKAKISANISAGLEYRYAFEREDKLKVISNTAGTIASSKFKQDAHAVLAKVSYHF
jgi:outer membrane immunogenic protein